jgi:hypothetical protein
LRRFHVGYGIGSCPKERCGSDEYGRKKSKKDWMDNLYSGIRKCSENDLFTLKNTKGSFETLAKHPLLPNTGVRLKF